MPEIIQNKKAFSLLEVSRSIKDTLAKRYTSTFWVKAEMIKLNHYKHSGHCYPDLVEKHQGKVIAQLRANLWKRDFERINALFTKILKEPLKDGIKILFLAKISFDPVYGLSLHILDIDPSFTLGDLEREKQECIEKLRLEGLLDKNKSTTLPLLPQRIAIISVETSKGYADFLKIIQNNPWGYAFFHFLFPSILQGEKAVDGIIYQLNRIRSVRHHFDVVAIIRGGGGDVGLSCYNDYSLSKAIASFPIPVITGIGHATNQTVAEMISYENAITPSKLAEMLLQHFHNFAQPVSQAQQYIRDTAKRKLLEAQNEFRSQLRLLKTQSQNVLKLNRQAMMASIFSLQKSVDAVLKNESREVLSLARQTGRQGGLLMQKHKLDLPAIQKNLSATCAKTFADERQNLAIVEKNIEILNPINVLKRGFSITRKNGKVISSTQHVEAGDEIETLLADGKISAIIKSKTNDTQ